MTTSSAVGSAAIEARAVHKVTVRIIPFVFILFVVAALDRNNIGFAALTMNKELGISRRQYGFIAGVFFFGYSVFEIPSNLLLHRIGARVWIARISITWGASLQFLLASREQRSTYTPPGSCSGLLKPAIFQASFSI